LLLAGCGSFARQEDPIPLERPVAQAQVETGRRPLSVPPIYGIRPGAVPEPARVPGRSVEPASEPRTAEEALVRAAGRADPQIRAQIASGPGVAALADDQVRTVLGTRPGARQGIAQAERRGTTALEPR
jgi:hypothetical protein